MSALGQRVFSSLIGSMLISWLLYWTETAGVATLGARRSPTTRSAYFADVTSSSTTADNDDDQGVGAANEPMSNSRCYGDCDCTSDTGSHTPTSVTSSNSDNRRTTSSTGDLYRAPAHQHTLLHVRQQRKKRSRAAFSHAQASTSSTSSCIL